MSGHLVVLRLSRHTEGWPRPAVTASAQPVPNRRKTWQSVDPEQCRAVVRRRRRSAE
ncbi:hypothetical protein PFWH6_2399 [Pseudomonas fluorescens WH6]|nr:hypothetical protein PFWH6_2399 [Pseudomonas fluorescens WH6]